MKYPSIKVDGKLDDIPTIERKDGKPFLENPISVLFEKVLRMSLKSNKE